jgi:YHS domain-containing protein
MIRFPRIRKLLPGLRFSLRTLMLVVALIAVGLWWYQRAAFFLQMARKHQEEAKVYHALGEAHRDMATKCKAIVDYHAGLEEVYRKTVYTPWMIIYEHPYETSVVSEVKLAVDSVPAKVNSFAAPPQPKQASTKPELALEGYCPVSLSRKHRWEKGDSKYSAVFEGNTFHFAGPEELQAFLKEPLLYAPACNGNDVVRLLDDQQTSPGSRNYGVSYENRNYFFESEKTRAAFEANPTRYLARAASGSIVK